MFFHSSREGKPVSLSGIAAPIGCTGFHGYGLADFDDHLSVLTVWEGS